MCMNFVSNIVIFHTHVVESIKKTMSDGVKSILTLFLPLIWHRVKKARLPFVYIQKKLNIHV